MSAVVFLSCASRLQEPFENRAAVPNIDLRYPVEDLQEPLAEGIVTGHPPMPEFNSNSNSIPARWRHHRLFENARALIGAGFIYSITAITRCVKFTARIFARRSNCRHPA